MLHEESDIDFTRIDNGRFEELCFDLLVKSGYHTLAWRQGGADKGRDIEASLTVSSQLLGPYTERWFVECKRYKNAVPPEELHSKYTWATAERPRTSPTRPATGSKRCGRVHRSRSTSSKGSS